MHRCLSATLGVHGKAAICAAHVASSTAKLALQDRRHNHEWTRIRKQSVQVSSQITSCEAL